MWKNAIPVADPENPFGRGGGGMLPKPNNVLLWIFWEISYKQTRERDVAHR